MAINVNLRKNKYKYRQQYEKKAIVKKQESGIKLIEIIPYRPEYKTAFFALK